MSWTLTVTDLNEYVRRCLAGDPMLRDVLLKGEISNFKRHVSGHLYFSLKDDQARIQCVMFRQDALSLSFSPADGSRVTLRGSVSLYTAAGSYQFYAREMTQDGLGALYVKLEQLKKRLAQEGLFDEGKKRPLPLLPRMVGVVTSRTGAVIHDIAQVARRRNPSVQLVLRPALVQGEGAAADVAAGIKELSQVPGVDVIIIGRGGGSLEDLWAFNEEAVVRAVAACPVPVISAVGHETDFTLADFAADVRAATPSVAAELAVQDRATLENAVEGLLSRLYRSAHETVLLKTGQIAALEKRMALAHPGARLKGQRALVAEYLLRLNQKMREMLEEKRALLRVRESALTALGPKGALRRGYVIALSKDGTPVTSAARAPEAMRLLFEDGTVTVRTISKEEGDPFGGKDEEL